MIKLFILNNKRNNKMKRILIVAVIVLMLFFALYRFKFFGGEKGYIKRKVNNAITKSQLKLEYTKNVMLPTPDVPRIIEKYFD